MSATGAASKAPPPRWRQVFVVPVGPGAAESQTTTDDQERWLALPAMALPILIMALVVWQHDFGMSGAVEVTGSVMALAFVGLGAFVAVRFAKVILGSRFIKVTIGHGVVRGRAINGFSVPVDRWEAPLEGHRIRPVRIPQRLRDRPSLVTALFTVSDGPVLPFGAATIRLEHPTVPERSVVLIRENNVPAAELFPLAAEAAHYAAHLALPLAELVEEPEFLYPPPRRVHD